MSVIEKLKKKAEELVVVLVVVKVLGSAKY